ncbi:DUF3052 family protein [Undibacterium terreum]|uniref:DUF3052 domain-containing protein n=1 Tax=Undibacterium terreum TaxID=1224302 RepID=A0A916XEI4_9BURK|nr:DUF3052 family protein [Undibacterium terreum]GGC65986.1 DUF3052 domain-containing protein [Undibacterium terreum]
MTSPPSGYSGTPLAKKLGISEGCRVFVGNAPDGYAELLASLPPGVLFEKKLTAQTDIAHLFCDKKADLQTRLLAARKLLQASGAVWVSWPKKASKVPTDITEDTIRELALPLGFVDIKVCAVNEIWSGLKLVIRKELR